MSTNNNFGYPPRRSARLSTHHSPPPPSPPPPKATICRHLQFGWFNNLSDPPVPSLRAPQDVLRELLANAIVGGNNAEDREFISRILASAERHRQTPDSFQPPSSFPRFPDLPAEIRNEIWLLSLPNRTIHVGDYEGDRICWNRRLSIPAPALACREAWDVIWPLMHEIFHRDPLRSRTGLEPTQNKRASWITPGDTLSLGYENEDALGVNTAYQDNIAVFRDIAIPLEQMERAVGFGWLPMMSRASSNFKFHLLERLGIIIHTIVIDIDDGPHLFGGFGEIEGSATLPFSNPVQYLNPEKNQKLGHSPTAVVDLRDKRRMAELLSLVSVNGGSPWRACSRLDAIRDWNQAFCTDCLETWWENRVQVRAKEAMAKVKALEVWKKENHRTIREPPLEEIRESKLPELVPTVRFFFRFSGCHPPGITIHEAEELIGPITYDSCYAGMSFPGDLSDEDL